jgi:phosphoglycerol transferase MdoB-like AlkP superfamily enzyme
MVYAPGLIEPGENATLCSQIDIAPTLLGMLGCSYESCFFGKDILRDPPERAFLSNYQKVGYLKDGVLTILKPVKKASYLEIEEAVHPDASQYLDEAVSYFQTASLWRELNKVSVE